MRNRIKNDYIPTDESISKSIPKSVIAEEAVIGAIYDVQFTELERMSMLNKAINAGMNEDWFNELENREIWKMLVKMKDDGRSLDLINLDERLTAHDLLIQVGGRERIQRLCASNAISSTGQFEGHIEILRNKYVARRGIAMFKSAESRLRIGIDPVEEVIAETGRELSEISNLTMSNSSKMTLMDAIDETFRIMDERSEGRVGLKTGFYDLDQATRGLRPGQVWIVAGRPGSGKTALGLGISKGIAESIKASGSNGSVLMFSLEMTYPELVERLIASYSMVDTSRIECATEHERMRIMDGGGQLAKLNDHLCVDTTPELTITKLAALAHNYVKERFVKLIVIDYLQLLDVDERSRARDGREVMDEVSRKVKVLARELNVPIIALAQLNRESEKDSDRKPRMSDIRNSGQIEQDADFIGILYERGGSKDEDSSLVASNTPRDVMMRIVKQRSGKSNVDVPFVFRPQFTRFDSVAKISEKDIPK